MPRGPHREEIKAAVRMKGKTLTQVAIDAGLPEATARIALIRPLIQGEAAIATFLGEPPQKLWPDRYDRNGTPKHPRARAKFTPSRTSAVSQKAGAK